MFPRALRALLEGARTPPGREEGVVLSSYRANPPESDPQQVSEWGRGALGGVALLLQPLLICIVHKKQPPLHPIL